jgi:hypothetical protein
LEIDKFHLSWSSSTLFETSKSQSLFYITGTSGDTPLTIAVAVEWECCVVYGIVFTCQKGITDPDTLMFLMYCNEDGNKEITGVVLTKKEIQEDLAGKTLTFDLKPDEEFVSLDIPCPNRGFLGGEEMNKLASSISRAMVVRGNSVRFCDYASVVLIPRSRACDFKKSDTVYYTSLDYKRFTRDMNGEVEAAMNKWPDLSKEDIVTRLYQLAETRKDLRTADNINVLARAASPVPLDPSPLTRRLSSDGSGLTIFRSFSDSALSTHSRQLLEEMVSNRHSDLDLTAHFNAEVDATSRENDSDDDDLPMLGGRRVSMDDVVDRNKVEEQQIAKQLQWLEQHDQEHSTPFMASTTAAEHSAKTMDSRGSIASNSRESSGSGDAESAARSPKKSAANNKAPPPSPTPGCLLKRYVAPAREVLPTVVHVSVIACNNLKQPALWPVAPVNPFVCITVNGESQSTEVVMRHRNPNFDSSQVYTFVLSPESAPTGHIDFAVFNKTLRGNLDWGVARVALAAIKAQPDDCSPTSVILPLLNQVDDKAIGRGFWNSDNYEFSRVDHLSVDGGSTSQDRKKAPIISLTITKVDPTLHDMLRKLRAEDEERTAQRGPIEWLTI